jgi:hypothetical protein
MRAVAAGLSVALVAFFVAGCGIYSPYGAQTSGAETYSVAAFEMVTPLASASSALALTEALRDRIQRQSTLRLVDAAGELQFSGEIVTWEISPVNVQGDETAASNRLTIGLAVHYENSKDPDLSFDRTFTRFADYSSDLDLLQVEDALVEDIGAQLSQDVFNASLGNW